MSTKKLQLFLLVSTAILAFTGAAKAQILTGSINASVYPGDQGEATASSLTLFQTNVISATTGDFIGSVPTGGYLTAYYPSTIDGLSTSPLDVSINNYFIFSVLTPFGSAGGTTPSNRFEFNLQTITETSYSGDGIGDFSGTGTLVDITGAYSSSAADFTLDFTSPGIYSFTLTTVPEPTTISLVATGLLGVLALRRRKG